MRLTRRGRVTYDDCGWRDDASPDFVQWWYFDAELEDGHRLMAILLPRAFGRVEGHENGPDPTITLTITDPAGRNHRARAFYPGRFTARVGPAAVTFGASAMSCRDGRYRLQLDQGGLACDLTYEPLLAPWAPLPGRDGRLATPLLQLAQGRWTPGAYFHYASVLPRAAVHGSVSLSGRTTPVRGAGYHEQGRSNLPFTRLFAFWYWTRAYLGDWTIVFPVAATTRRSRNLPLRALLLAHRGEVVCDRFDPSGVLLTHRVTESWYDPRSGRDVPRVVTFAARGRGLRLELEMELRHERERFRFEAFADPTPLAPLWLQHLTAVRGRVRWRGQEHALDGEGIFETMLSGAV